MQMQTLLLPSTSVDSSEQTFTAVAQPAGADNALWSKRRAIATGISLIVVAVFGYLSNVAWFYSCTPVFLGLCVVGGGLIFATGLSLLISAFRLNQNVILAILVLSLISLSMNTVYLLIWLMPFISSPVMQMILNPEPTENETPLFMSAIYMLTGLACLGLLLTSIITSSIYLCSNKRTCSHSHEGYRQLKNVSK